MIIDAITDAAADVLKILPFLFITYLVMEYIEHKAGSKTERLVQKAGRLGPLIGGVLGMVPQCGFSAAASNLYAGRIITLGTLISIFLSTSDEMLPILISEQAPAGMILKILVFKALTGALAGMVIDFVIRNRQTYGAREERLKIEEICDHQNCRCREGNIVRSAVSHTLQIVLFILVISCGLNLLIEWVGEESLQTLLGGKRVLGPVLAGVVGLIPNCAASVTITKLYLEGLLNAGSMAAGLLVGAGVGLLVLFRVNEDLGENLKATFLLYGVGVLSGILVEMAGLIF